MQDKDLDRFGGFFEASSLELCSKWVNQLLIELFGQSNSMEFFSMWGFFLFSFLKWWSVIITDMAVRVGTDKVMQSVKCWAPVSWSMQVYHLTECTVGSPVYCISCLINICAFLCTGAAVFPLKLYDVLNCLPTLVTVLPLEVWNTEKFSLRFLLL